MWFGSKNKGHEEKTDVLSPEEQALIDKIARKIVEHQMTVPAILFLESVRPLNFIGSQVLIFFQPFIQIFFTMPDYERFALIMEKRENVENLIVAIEGADVNHQQQKE